MRCPRCKSENLIKIGHLIYCRNCISFGQVRAHQQAPKLMKFTHPKSIYYDLSYDLSVKQQEIASAVVDAIHKHQHVLIQAVCGSGKTELVYPCICDSLNRQLNVGFACPRKDLAIELYDRLSSQLKNVEIALVYGGHTNDLYKPLVVLTTHQLYRYWHYFDVLIIDEVDAFPFYGNTQLYQMAVASNRGSFVMMSATSFEGAPPKGFVKFTLNRRYHDHDLPVPRLIWLPDYLSLFYLYYSVKKCLCKDQLVMVFVPTVQDLYRLQLFFKQMHLSCEYVHSNSEDISQVLSRFRNKSNRVLLTTTLLERGVTFENVQVFVYRADHRVFSTSTLIQIAGRVGRKPNYPSGLVVFIGRHLSKEMKACRKHLRLKNALSA